MSSPIKKIGVLTSGGDAPGMNAAIRAVVRTAFYNKIAVVGVKRGYEGLLTGDIVDLDPRSVSDILHKGGTMLLTARCDEMRKVEVQEKAARLCQILKFDALIIIGGDGTIKGGAALAKFGLNVIGIPGTIDLDMPASDYTIGFNTAISTGMDAIGKIRDTSTSHERCSVVEVMGRDSGAVALNCALIGGAEEILIPEKPEITTDVVIKQIIENRAKGKKHNMIIVAEGVGHSQELAKEIQKATGIETRATILGHLQRGGSPTATDRECGSLMGNYAVEALLKGKKNRVVIMKNGDYTDVDIYDALEIKRVYNDKLYNVIKLLAI